MLLLSEGQVGDVRELLNKAVLFPPQTKVSQSDRATKAQNL